ncbi:ImmA/IrrE family metallo-endopeptidase [Acuticoccus yangtzensis]|uniref:ImmA/IrrE family metallo-endopeptidase n=1 Tax=Acuticoccus yangtzensis TaxID=1443441 RepID=UPI001B3B75F3|nr:ImmA/IrrE family metallo-endopeptidase [Acuticoccus yangtzensis]
MHIPRSAEQILSELSIGRPQEIDLEAIAWLQGAKVKYRPLDSCEACIRGSAELGRAIISINEDAMPRRQRFSLAHEIGHWEWDRGKILRCKKEDINGSQGRLRGISRERMANKFAAELLMPEGMLKKALRDFRKFDMYVVRQLSAEFDVSRTAMAYRLVELDHEPCMLVAHGRNGCRWFVRSKSLSERWYPADTLDPQSNAYDILYNEAEDDRFMSTMEADIWFDVPWARDLEIGEQSFRTAPDEVMTLIVAKSEGMLAD